MKFHRTMVSAAFIAVCLTMPVMAQITAGTLDGSARVRGIGFEPANPIQGQEVFAFVDEGWCRAGQYELQREGNLIKLLRTPVSNICPSVPLPIFFRTTANLGRLTAGEYTLRVAAVSTNGLPTQTTISETVLVVAAGTATPRANFSGMWFDPTSSGWGVSFIQSSTGQAFATLYAYQPVDGVPVWYGIPGGVWTAPNRFEGTMYATGASAVATGGIFVPNSAIEAVGRMTIVFDDFAPDTARMSYVLYVRALGSNVTMTTERLSGARTIRKLAY